MTFPTEYFVAGHQTVSDASTVPTSTTCKMVLWVLLQTFHKCCYKDKVKLFFFKCYINVSGLYHQKHILVKKQTLEPECLGSDLNSIQVNLPALVSSSLKEGLIVPTYLWMWSWTIKKAECWRIDAFFFFNWCFWTVVLEKTLESPLDCRESQPVYPKGNRSWIIGRTDAEAEIPILWPPDVKN